jgi:hypothetical protein
MAHALQFPGILTIVYANVFIQNCLDIDYKHMDPGVEQGSVQMSSEQVILCIAQSTWHT